MVVLKAVVALVDYDDVDLSEARLQSSSQASSDELSVAQRPKRGRSSQGALRVDFVKEELKRLLGRGEARAEAAPRSDFVFQKIRRRSWLSVVDVDSGAWLTAGASPKMFETSNDEFGQSFVGETRLKTL